MRLHAEAVVASLWLTSSVAATAHTPTVHLANGTVTGAKCPASNVNYYFSIPYAQPPTGDLRFAPPRRFDDTFGTLNATVPPPACIQFDKAFNESSPESEDCLLVNVWAPVKATPKSRLPVKVWIYGGSNMAGGIANPTYSGCDSAVDSVVVSINYRVGPLGFLALKGLGLRGNMGIMDQLLGLRWVQDNVDAFGGDPSKVMVFGQSAGAVDVFTLAAMEEAPAVMRAAAMQSGGGRDIATIEQVQKWQTTYSKALNCSTTDITCFRAASTDELVAAIDGMPQDSVLTTNTPLVDDGARTSWGPVVDGGFVKKSPAEAGVRVPSIFGSNSKDGSLGVLSFYGVGALTLNQTVYDAFLRGNFGRLAARVNDTFAAHKFGGVAAAMTAIATDVEYKCPAYNGAVGAAARGVPSWTYEFAHTPSCSWYKPIKQEYIPFLGATHTAEIPFVFNTTQNMPPPNGSCTLGPREVHMARAVSRAWTDMAERGSPGRGDFWPRFSNATMEGVRMQDKVHVHKLDYSSCAFWNEIQRELKRDINGGSVSAELLRKV